MYAILVLIGLGTVAAAMWAWNLDGAPPTPEELPRSKPSAPPGEG